MQELRGYLGEGTSLDQLWKVANGEVKYADFLHQRKQGDSAQEAPAPKQEQMPTISDALVGLSCQSKHDHQCPGIH